MSLVPFFRRPQQEWNGVHMTRRFLLVTPLCFMRRRVVNLFPVIGEVQQETVRIGGLVVLNQTGDHKVIVKVSVVIIIVSRLLVLGQTRWHRVGFTREFVPVFRVAILVVNMRPQQVNDNKLLRRRVSQNLFKRCQNVGIIFTCALGTLLVHVKLLIGLLREYREHSVA